MAEIYTKSTTVGNENCVITDYREALVYPFKIQDWNRIKVALVWSYTASSGNDNMDGYGTTQISINGEKDKMYFGLKKYSGKFPFTDISEYFVGIASHGTYSDIAFPQTVFDERNPHGQLITLGVHHADGVTTEGETRTENNPTFGLMSASGFSGAGNFAGIICLDLTISNKGLSNQQISFKYAKSTITDTSKANVESVVNSLTYTDVGLLNFNLNGVSYSLPDCFFMYLPFGNLRLRTFALDVFRVS